MIRNLKVLIAAAMALAAFGALSASAHAAEEFHCSVEPNCRATLAPDEAAGTTTAHHVFVVKGKTSAGAEGSVSFTCNQLTGEATSPGKTASELTFTNLKYENSKTPVEDKCKVGSSETVTVDFNGCDYKFTSKNGSKALPAEQAEVHVVCPKVAEVTQVIVITINGTPCLKIGEFSAPGISYHDSGIGGAKKIVTATANVAVPNSALTLENIANANCTAIGLATTSGATYTTGNTLVKAETEAGVTAEAWFE
jgi:hypothetical protein